MSHRARAYLMGALAIGAISWAVAFIWMFYEVMQK